jgi:hypothetical protein
MDIVILIIRLGLMITGLAVWVIVLAFFFGFMAHIIRCWSGWGKIRDWWWLANGGNK